MDTSTERLDRGEFDLKEGPPVIALHRKRGVLAAMDCEMKIPGAAMLMATLLFSASNGFDPHNTFGGEEEMGQPPEENGSNGERASWRRDGDRKPVDFVVPPCNIELESSVVSWNECVLPSWCAFESLRRNI